jgi:phosphatidylinositol alpha-1,6-mannosyltransferase
MLAFSTVYRKKCLDLYKTKKVFLVPPGVDCSHVETANARRIWDKHSLPADTRAVVTVNKLIIQKNVDVLIRAMAEVVRGLPEARAFIVGDGPERKKLEALTAELGLEKNVIFSGFIKEWSEVCDYYAASAALVFLEKDVPFGMTPVEAGRFSKPAIAVASGGALDTVEHQKTGYLVSDALSTKEIADRIKALLADKELCSQLGRAANTKAGQFSWTRCATEYVQALEKTIQTATTQS